MVAKLCFRTKREVKSFILNISRWPGLLSHVCVLTMKVEPAAEQLIFSYRLEAVENSFPVCNTLTSTSKTQ